MKAELILPGNTRGVVEALMKTHHFTIGDIAERISASERTVYRLRQGSLPSPAIHRALTMLYIRQVVTEH